MTGRFTWGRVFDRGRSLYVVRNPAGQIVKRCTHDREALRACARMNSAATSERIRTAQEAADLFSIGKAG